MSDIIRPVPIGTVLESPAESFTAKRQLLFALGYFIDASNQYPDFTDETYSRLCGNVHEPTHPKFEAAVVRYQEFQSRVPEAFPGLIRNDEVKVDGDFGPETEKLITVRQCGCPDILPLGEGLARWSFKDVLIWSDCEFTGVPESRADRAYVEAANMWNAASGIRLTPTGRKQDAHIYAHAKRIDGSGGTLAWSYLPSNRGSGSGSSTKLEQRYDTGERWSTKIDTLLRPTMCHELGHAIGLSHSRDPADIMYYAMNGTQRPNTGDIADVQRRYGPPIQQPEPEPEPPTPNDPAVRVIDGSIAIQVGGQTINLNVSATGTENGGGHDVFG